MFIARWIMLACVSATETTRHHSPSATSEPNSWSAGDPAANPAERACGVRDELGDVHDRRDDDERDGDRHPPASVGLLDDAAYAGGRPGTLGTPDSDRRGVHAVCADRSLTP